MITLYPPSLGRLRQLGSPSDREVPPPDRFFLSFEDALGFVLEHVTARPAVALLPGFYCMDMVGFLRRFGIESRFYEVSADLCPDEASLRSLLAPAPQLVVVFHALGIPSPLLSNRGWINDLHPDSILLEDRAHCSEAPAGPYPLHPRHLRVNSLRKVSPLQGAALEAPLAFALPRPSMRNRCNVYRFRLGALFCLWRAVLRGATSLGSPALFRVSERLFEAHTGAVGAFKAPALGFGSAARSFAELPHLEIARRKAELCRNYEALLRQGPVPSSRLSVIPIDEAHFERLKFYPVKVASDLATRLLTALSKQCIYVDVMYPDSPTGRSQAILALPLDPTLSAAAAGELVSRIRELERELA